jgi:hypothetical protein
MNCASGGSGTMRLKGERQADGGDPADRRYSRDVELSDFRGFGVLERKVEGR